MMPYIHWEDWLRIHNFRFSWWQDGLSASNLNSFVFVLIRLRASDPRDKIYGLLGLADADVVSNHSKTSSKAFREFAGHCIALG
jgi:hypothetical protein